jgi:hypothetical protein
VHKKLILTLNFDWICVNLNRVFFKFLNRNGKLEQLIGVFMVGSVYVWLKKIFSLSLILNSLITLTATAGILYGVLHAWPYWKPFSPYLISGDFFLVAAIAAIINVFPSASIGRALHTGRFLFHHYVYGFCLLLASSFLTVTFASVSLVSLFLINTTSITVNAGRFFVLGGLTLFLDDLPDVSKRVESALNKLKSSACQIRRAIHWLQLVTGLITFYVFLAIVISVIIHPAWTVANFITMGSLLITSITAFACVKRKTWLKITPAN